MRIDGRVCEVCFNRTVGDFEIGNEREIWNEHAAGGGVLMDAVKEVDFVRSKVQRVAEGDGIDLGEELDDGCCVTATGTATQGSSQPPMGDLEKSKVGTGKRGCQGRREALLTRKQG